MKTFFALSIAMFAAFSALGDEILTDKIYLGSQISYCGKISDIGSGTRADTPYAILYFRSEKDGVRIRLDFWVRRDSMDLNQIKPGSYVRAYGVCMEHRLYCSSAKDLELGRSFFNLEMQDCALDIPAKGQQDGFMCVAKGALDPKPPSGSAAATDSSSENPLRQIKRAVEENFDVSFDEQRAMKSIVTVKGSKGSGSAFIANIDGKKLLVTNIHVIFDNEMKFLTVSNEEVEVLEPQLSKDRDLAFYELREPDKFAALDLEADIAKLPPEQPVVVFGNSLGAGVNTRLKGKVKGVGPTTVEISAEIVPGNSGSPILNSSNGKVIGVSTYGTVTRRADFSVKGTRFEEVRRFGTRMDTEDMAALEPFDKRKYNADVKLYNSIAAVNELGLALLTDICEQKDGKSSPTIEPSRYDFKKYISLEPAIREWNDILNGKIAANNKSTINVASGLKRFKNQISMPIMNARKQQANYSWVRDAVAKQIELNDSYCKSFDDIRKEVEELARK